jgi:PAS domain S-box-containing protein
MAADRPDADMRVLLLAPTSRDGEATRSVLAASGIGCVVCPSLDDLCAEAVEGAAAVIMPEEAVLSEESAGLADHLRRQPVWSDLPVIVLSSSGAESPAVARAVATLGNVSLVERPMRVSTLLSVIRAALRARERQYQVRGHLEQQRRAETELRESEERYRRLVETAHEGVWTIDAEGRTTYVNQRMAELLGYAPEEMIGRVHTEFMWEQDRPKGDVDMELRRQGMARVWDQRYRRKDGGELWTVASCSALHEADGRFVGALGMFSDITGRKRAEERLRTSEERLALAVGSAELGTFYCPMPLGRIEWNDTCKAHFWLPPDAEIDFDLFYSVIHPEDRERTRQAVERAVYAREPYDIEYRTVAPDGRERWIRAMGRAYYDAAGNPVRFDGVTLDVTDRRKVVDALRESERRFQEMADTAPAMLWVTEADGYCSFLSRGWYEFTGQTEAQGLGFGWTDAAHPDDRAGARDAFLAANAARRGYALDFRIRRADGEYRWVIDAGRPRFDPGGEFLGFIGSVIDITDRKRAEGALRDSESRLLLAVSIAQMGTFEIDLLTDAVTVNDAGRDIYGWALGDPLKFSQVQTHFHPEDKGHVMRRVADAFRPEGPGEFEVEQRIIRTAGDTRWIRVRGRASFEGAAGGERRAVRCVGTFLDITDQKESERQRERLLASERAARAEAERASRMKDDFLATLSHELRTPLNAILGWSQILSQLAHGGGFADDLREGLATIERNARAQTQIIEDLLDMSRIVSGKVRLDMQRLDLAEVVRAAVETVRPAAEAKGVRVQTVVDPLAGPVSGDPNRLQQVLWNLLNNAVKFTPRGGRVQVLLERVNSHLEVSVIDTGEGIPPEFLPHVFDRFRQADASTTRRHGGLGLGLSIVKQLVELHGGRVRASSSGEGSGSTFTVSLPLTVIHPPPEPEAGRRHPVARTGPHLSQDTCVELHGVRVLVVDDEPDARSLLQRLLEDCHAIVMLAESAGAALEKLVADRPDVLVSDIGMPGEDGYSLIRRVRALHPDKGGNVPALALTAYARSEDRTRSVLAGFQMHMSKPVEPAELIAMVASLAGRTGRAV